MLTDTLHTYEGRTCSVSDIIAQVGVMNILAISGGPKQAIYNADGEPVGLRLPMGRGRRVDIVLDWSDTYTVRRVRQITRGAQRGSVVVEYERADVYCDEVGEIAYWASCWR